MSDRAGFELGYALMNKFVRYFTDSYTVYLLLHAIVVYSVFYWFTKKTFYDPNHHLQQITFQKATC